MARFYGTTQVNVFIGAFANAAQEDSKLEFEAFLSKVAPYETEDGLAKWLGNVGYVVVREGTVSARQIFADVYHRLESTLADQIERGDRNLITVRHDAIQLAILDEDRRKGIRSLLVSADRRLRESLRNSRLVYLANGIITGLALTQLIDLMVGNAADDRGLTMLYWASHISTGTDAVRNFLIDKALDQYDEAIAMQMGDLVDGIAQEAAREADRRGIDLTNGQRPDVASAIQFVGTFEDKFYTGMREIIERRRSQK
jgi:GNAT superfamily N-acetyltransferase